MRTLLFAMNRPPLLIHPGSTPVSDSNVWRIWSQLTLIKNIIGVFRDKNSTSCVLPMREMSVSEGRRRHSRPAVCQVVPVAIDMTNTCI